MTTGQIPDVAAHYPLLRSLALRGSRLDVPDGTDDLEATGLVASTRAGYMLTGAGSDLHDRILEQERARLNAEKVRVPYQLFLGVNSTLKAHAMSWFGASADRQFEILGAVADSVAQVTPSLTRTAGVLPRFATYVDRLRVAVTRAEGGELDFVVGPRVESVHTVWMEIHEDYLQLLGISREDEGSY